MNSGKSARPRWRIWVAAGVIFSLSLTALVLIALPVSRGTISIPDPGLDALHPADPPSLASAAFEIDIGELSESLAHALEARLDEWNRRGLESSEKRRLERARARGEWERRLDEKVETQLSGLQDMGQRLRALERGVDRLLASLEEPANQASAEPAFTFRGVEVWHGRPYALLEHQGRILPVREGESRLGWRIRAIDRAGGKLRVSDGATERLLEKR